MDNSDHMTTIAASPAHPNRALRLHDRINLNHEWKLHHHYKKYLSEDLEREMRATHTNDKHLDCTA